MNSKERIKASIGFRSMDKIPVMYRALNFTSFSLMKHFNIGKPDDPDLLLKKYKELIAALKIDAWSSGCNIGKFSTFVPRYKGPELDFIDNNYYSAVGIPTKPKTIAEYDYTFTEIISNPLAGAQSPGEVKGFLTKKLDFFDYDKLINNALNLRASGAFGSKGKKTSEGNLADRNEDLQSSEERLAESLSMTTLAAKGEEFICMGNVLSSPYMLCSYLRGMDTFLLDLAGNKVMAEAVIGEVKDFVIEFNRRYIKSATGRCEYFGCWDDVAMQNGMMFPPGDFIKYFLPVWNELISMVKSAGMFFSWHCCGNVNEVLPLMIDAGIDVFDVVQTSARDMEIGRFYSRFGKSVCIHGGIDVQKLLVSGTHSQIKEEVKKIKGLWERNGGIILGPSHEIVPETPVENLIVLYDELAK